ncbi:MAG: pirin family protein [Polyangiales bacterium]
MERRTLLGALATSPLIVACTQREPSRGAFAPVRHAMNEDPVRAVLPLGAPPWPTPDPFLFCVHHDDDYPAGNERFGPAASLSGRQIGMDFAGIDGWRMYHGETVPGFPSHPHRGFETVTVVRRGLIDHSDSLGAAARYGHGDVQWLTAGRGIVHAEMFPLLERERRNPAELFQLWLNLPRADKMADPHFTMFWRDAIPRHVALDADGRSTEVTVIAGRHGDLAPPRPPPRSYASRPESDVAIWTLKMAPGARYTLPAAQRGTNRSLYFFRGTGLRVGARDVPGNRLVELHAHVDTPLVNGADEGEVLILQGRPIGEPVVQHGPFVMNTRAEIQQAISDYQRTRFGGWPWPNADPVHGAEGTRFARHADGRRETAPT